MSKGQVMKADDMELLLQTRNKHPILYNRIVELLNLVHDPLAKRADDMEFDVIGNLRNMGNDALTSWSSNQTAQATTSRLEQEDNLRLSEKKVHWKTTYGEIKTQRAVIEDKFWEDDAKLDNLIHFLAISHC